NLSWRARGGATGYTLIRTRVGSTFPPPRQFNLPPDQTSYQDKSSITDKRTYSYRMIAFGCPNSSPGTNPVLGPVEVTPPDGPQSGVEPIAIPRSPSGGQFLYEVDLLLFAPRWDAVITSVTNVAVDVNNEKKVPFGRVHHVDAATNA